MMYLGDIKIQTATDVNEVLGHITALETGLNAPGIGLVLFKWMETRLERNLDWVSTSRKELQDAKDTKFENDLETKTKIEDGLSRLDTVESKIQGMISRSNEAKKLKQRSNNVKK
ncbi:hypothetical protein K449DRAFT_400093 [Hypoxylon sp. EC38]|nr:hypothetical protein K449DRAFT_400093 [Hypoxylon sp. EC38]